MTAGSARYAAEKPGVTVRGAPRLGVEAIAHLQQGDDAGRAAGRARPRVAVEEIKEDGTLSKAEIQEILDNYSNPDVSLPLEAKYWSKQQLEMFVMTGGAIRPKGCSMPDERLLVNATMSKEQIARAFGEAAAWIADADAVLIGSGAGMGVDSGLNTFRGSRRGVWAGLEAVGLAYEEICHPRWFQEEPRLGWAFWNFCHRAYRGTAPHPGYAAVRELAQRCPLGFFSFTSNIDSHWAASGMRADNVLEVHGAVRWLQCSVPCCPDVWRAPRDLGLSEDEATHRARGALPTCPKCQAVARPNVQMFGGDSGFSKARRGAQFVKYDAWLKRLEARADRESLRVACVEIGCGLTVPTVRKELESVVRRFPGARLIRVNPENPGLAPELADRGASLPVAAGLAIQELSRQVQVQAEEPPVTFVLWGMWESGGVEIQAPYGSSVGRLVRLAGAQEGASVDFDHTLKGWPQVVVGGAPEVAPDDPIPVHCFQEVRDGDGKERRLTAVVVVEAQIWVGEDDSDNMNGPLRSRCREVETLLDDLNALFEQQSYQDEVRKCRDRRSVHRLAKSVQFQVLPKYGIEATERGTAAMMAFISSCCCGDNWASWAIQEKVDRSMDLSYIKHIDHLPLVTPPP